MEELSSYGIDREGFRSRSEPLRRLPQTFDAWEHILPDISALIRAQGLRAKLERERAMLILTAALRDGFEGLPVQGGIDLSIGEKRFF